jgi:membrane protein YqaA with SNARE-associated domain
MKRKITAYLIVALTGAVKFLPAVVLSYSQQFNFWEILITASAGGIAGTVVYTYFGTEIRKWIQHHIHRKKKRKINFKRLRTILKLWHRFGIYGIAFLTPPILSPPIGVAIAVAFKEKPRHIILVMSVSFLFWALLLATLWELGISVAISLE